MTKAIHNARDLKQCKIVAKHVLRKNNIQHELEKSTQKIEIDNKD